MDLGPVVVIPVVQVDCVVVDPVVVGPVGELDCVVVDPAVVIGPVVEVDCVVVDPAVVAVVAGGRQVTYKFKATLIYDN